jgi:hypothetical protein
VFAILAGSSSFSSPSPFRKDSSCKNIEGSYIEIMLPTSMNF